VKVDARSDLDHEDNGDEEVDGGAERGPPAGVGDKSGHWAFQVGDRIKIRQGNTSGDAA
jgi:hypothetical protein